MAKYTVKSGDTKTSLQKQYGIDINSSAYRSKDPNKLFAGEVLDIGAPVQGPVQPVLGPVQPVIQGPVQTKIKGPIDLSTVVEDKKTVTQPADSTITTPTDTTNTTEPTPFVSTSTPTDATTSLSSKAKTLQSEITALEESIANKESTRTTALDDAGVFTDMQNLNKLKEELRLAKNKEIAIPIEEKQKLRGQQATITEYNAAKQPLLENAALASLTASNNVATLTDAINTNIKIIEQKLTAQFEKDTFLYESKVKQLEKIEQIHADIITEAQKSALEDRKFQQQLLLEGVKADFTIKGDLLKEIAKMGIGGPELDTISSGSIDDMLKFLGNKTSATNWDNLDYETAARTLDKDTFEKYKNYTDFKARGGMTEAQSTLVAGGLAVQQGSDSIISRIEKMLGNTSGLKDSVGIGLGNWNLIPDAATNQFRADFKTLFSKETLNTLVTLKTNGASLGAVSDAELKILQNAEQAFGQIIDSAGNITGRSNLSEEDFKTALETMRLASMKVYVATGIGKQAYADANLQNADFDTVQKMYNDLKKNGSPALQGKVQYGGPKDYAAEELSTAATLIKNEEGFRSQAYQDQTGKWTIGFGTTMINGRPVKPGDSLSREQATSIMHEQIVNNYTNFADTITKDITPNQFAALTSFEYNLGGGVWNTTTGRQILASINAGRFSEAGQLMKQYNKSKNPQTGQLALNPVLAKRREREASLLLT